jgi:hypothetical protein
MEIINFLERLAHTPHQQMSSLINNTQTALKNAFLKQDPALSKRFFQKQNILQIQTRFF